MLKKRVQMDSIKNSWKYEKDLIIFNTIGAIFSIPKWLQIRLIFSKNILPNRTIWANLNFYS